MTVDWQIGGWQMSGWQAVPWIAALYAAMSVAAFAAIGRDKAAARRGERRIAEIHLHLLSVGGGWAGTWLACRVFRHKTQKRAFRRMFRLAAAANCAALAGLLYLLA